NSFKFVQRAIEHEIARQISVLEAGDKVVQETRLWDADKGTSASMRSKEHAHDYRYFPDPDLPPLAVADAWIDEVRAALPELPLARRARLAAEHGLGDADAKLLTEERSLADYFEAAAAAHGDGKKIANWVMTELLRELHRLGKEREDSPVPPDGLAELVRLVDDGTINGKIAKDVFHKMIESGGRARDIVAREGLTQLRDTGAIEEAARAVVAANPKQV